MVNILIVCYVFPLQCIKCCRKNFNCDHIFQMGKYALDLSTMFGIFFGNSPISNAQMWLEKFINIIIRIKTMKIMKYCGKYKSIKYCTTAIRNYNVDKMFQEVLFRVLFSNIYLCVYIYIIIKSLYSFMYLIYNVNAFSLRLHHHIYCYKYFHNDFVLHT